MFRNSVRGQIWDTAKQNGIDQPFLNQHNTDNIENGVNQSRKEPLERGFDNPKADQFTGAASGFNGQVGGSFIPNKNRGKGMSGFGANKNDAIINNNQASLNLDKGKIPNVFLEELEPLNLLDESKKNYTPSGAYNGFSITCDVICKKTEKNRRRTEIQEIMSRMKELKD